MTGPGRSLNCPAFSPNSASCFLYLASPPNWEPCLGSFLAPCWQIHPISLNCLSMALHQSGYTLCRFWFVRTILSKYSCGERPNVNQKISDNNCDKGKVLISRFNSHSDDDPDYHDDDGDDDDNDPDDDDDIHLIWRVLLPTSEIQVSARVISN